MNQVKCLYENAEKFGGKDFILFNGKGCSYSEILRMSEMRQDYCSSGT